MAIKLIAIDLDDTLLDNRQQLSPRTLTVLKQAMRKGVAVTIATGRMFQSALPFATELGIELPLITYNGALIRQGDSGETLFHRPIEPELAQELADLFRQNNWYFQKYVGKYSIRGENRNRIKLFRKRSDRKIKYAY